MYVGGKVNYVDKINANLFNVDELHLFVQDLGYDPEQLMFYHYKLPNKGLDYGLKPMSYEADVISLIKLVANCKVVEVFVEYWLTSVDHHYLSPFKSTVEIEELDDDVLNAPLVGNSKIVNVVGESSVGKNDNVPVDLNVNDYTIDDRFAFDIDENVNLEDYTVYVDQNKNENVNVVENVDENIDENMNENVNADDEYDSDENEQDNIEDEEGRGNDREDFIVDEEHVIDEVEVNMEGVTFSVEEQSADQNATPNVDLTDEALEVLDFDSFNSDVGDDTAKFANKELAKAKIKAHAVETRRKIGIVKNDNERLQAKCKGNVPRETRNSKSQGKNKIKGKSVNLVDEDKRDCPWKVYISVGDNLKWVDYCEALKKANPNTTVKVDVYRAHNPQENVRRFKRIYVCLGALKEGFRASGRQLLGLDGAFMKENYPGQLLTAVSVDVNNGIYPVAYGIGLLLTLKDLFPVAEHRYCVRHIHDNMNLIYKGGQYKELLWKCATATTEDHFERAMDEFKGYNRLQLLEARDNPVITALEYVREYLMKRIVVVQKVIEKSQGPLTPTVTKIFNAIKEKASHCVVLWNGAELFQVNEGRQNQAVVNLSNRSCTCRKWEVSGIPCKHAVACMFNMNDNEMEVGDVTKMVNDGKLTRRGGTITCFKCGQKGHNKRSCKETMVAGSGSASQLFRAFSSQPTRPSQPARATQPTRSSQPTRLSQPTRATQPASVKQPQRQPQRATSEPTNAPKPTRQTKIRNVAASGSQGAKNTPNKAKPKIKSCKEDPHN
ncbi:mutator type transposase [Tanacetum coccineum]